MASSEQSHNVQVRVLAYYYCVIPPKSCQCFVWRLQTPSLADSAAKTMFRFTINQELFELLTDTTYDLYWFAVGSNRAITRVLLPPEYPSIRIMFGFDRPDRRRHRHCPGAGTVRVRGHVPTPSTPLSLRSRLWLTLRKNYDAISVSNHFSFLPIVGSINRLYSHGSNHMVV